MDLQARFIFIWEKSQYLSKKKSWWWMWWPNHFSGQAGHYGQGYGGIETFAKVILFNLGDLKKIFWWQNHLVARLDIMDKGVGG